MKFSELRALISSDINRAAEFGGNRTLVLARIRLILTSAVMAVIFYRMSRYFYEKNLRWLAWMIYAFNSTITGAEILPYSRVGRGLILGHSRCTIIAGKVGENVTMYGQVAIGGGMGDLKKDVGAGKGLPVIEDNVVLGMRATVLGPIVIGEGATISASAFVRKDVPAGVTAKGNPCQIIRKK